MTIDVKAQLELLRELQDVDVHIREFEEFLLSVPALVEEAQKKWVQLSEELNAKKAENAAAEKERRRLEAELEDSESHLKDRESKLYTIKTNKEYQAAIKEIADSKKANKDREDAVLKLMEKIDASSKEIAQLSLNIAEVEKEYKKEEDGLKAKASEVEKDKAARVAEFKKIEEKIDKSVLDKYNFIRTRYLDPLAAVNNGICRGCNMNIPPQMFIDLLKGTQFHFCPSCYRFIYVGKEEENNSEEVKEGQKNED